MTPWLRALRATGLVLALGAGAAVSPFGSVPSYGAVHTYVEEADTADSAEPEEAGSGTLATPSPEPASSSPSAPTTASFRPTASSRTASPSRPTPSPRAASPARSAPSPLAAPSARAASPAAAARATPSDAGEPSRAGSRAGEGRVRPGRPEEAGEGQGLSDASALALPEEPPETDPVSASPSQQSVREAATTERPVGQVLRILPLGSGLVLIGLGLALAFVALRLRRV
ncbi:hypothetical protein [Streptomyces tibetensis]|uniref:hypothetical protein n=1 Tax=Streptomyces tibetensis TaxID=2382123 RepID=UPI0033E3D8AB